MPPTFKKYALICNRKEQDTCEQITEPVVFFDDKQREGSLQMADAKTTPCKSSVLHISVIQDNIVIPWSNS